MKVHWIANGKLQLILTGESELETLMLKQLFTQPVEVNIQEKWRVGEVDLSNAAIIIPQSKEQAK